MNYLERQSILIENKIMLLKTTLEIINQRQEQLLNELEFLYSLKAFLEEKNKDQREELEPSIKKLTLKKQFGNEWYEVF